MRAVTLAAAVFATVSFAFSGTSALRHNHRVMAVRDRLHNNLADLSQRRNAKRTLAAVNTPNDYFVTIGPDMNFYLGCSKFFFSGWNEWEVIEAGAGAPILYGASLPSNTTGPQLLREMMDNAVANNLTVMRAFATAVDPAYSLQPSPGVYNEAVFMGLDYALEQARQRGIKVILSLMDNWSNPGGIDQIVAWSGSAKARTDFFSDANCIRLYKDWVAKLINRVNQINGRLYQMDPTIMAWNLMNEPRCHGCPDALQNWIETMAAYVKSLDPYHLISIGSEGFYGINDKIRSDYANPQGPDTWANEEGQDFITNNQVPEIDFATVHSWADNWLDSSTAWQTRWIQQHDADAQQVLKKPIVVEEFGKWVKNSTKATQAERQQFYRLAYDMVLKSAQSGGAIKGVAFWEWFAEGQVAPAAEGFGTGLYGITMADPVWAFIKAAAQALLGLSTGSSCQFGKQANVPEVSQCQQTWVNGKPGTGYEGPSCNIDVNECVRGTAGCAANAACINSAGGFRCQCFWGYSGDGYLGCKPNGQIRELTARYYTEGIGRLACPDGENVPYPTTAPGHVDDPTGSIANEQKGFGSVVPVSVQDCQIACETAAGCDSFTYNPVQRQCFLKNGSSRMTCQNPETTCTSSNQDLKLQTFSCGSWQTYYRTGGAAATQILAAALTSSSTAG